MCGESQQGAEVRQIDFILKIKMASLSQQNALKGSQELSSGALGTQRSHEPG